jgi:hypothetical protein
VYVCGCVGELLLVVGSHKTQDSELSSGLGLTVVQRGTEWRLS